VAEKVSEVPNSKYQNLFFILKQEKKKRKKKDLIHYQCMTKVIILSSIISNGKGLGTCDIPFEIDELIIFKA